MGAEETGPAGDQNFSYRTSQLLFPLPNSRCFRASVSAGGRKSVRGRLRPLRTIRIDHSPTFPRSPTVPSAEAAHIDSRNLGSSKRYWIDAREITAMRKPESDLFLVSPF